ncbi:MAG: mechanosensitive ion channel domain-containing protein [Cyanobacteria bacterium P01_A01_bin.37]
MILQRAIWFAIAIIFFSQGQIKAQEADAVLPDNTTTSTANSADDLSSSGLYFADVIVRGRPVFQIGSLADISAQERASIINRRITSLISNSEFLEEVTVQVDLDRNLAILKFNNRVLMTVTDQDAQDYGLSVEELAEVWGDRLTQSLQQQPLAIDVAQRLNTTLRQLGRQTISGIPAFVGALIVLSITWAIARGVRYGAFTWAQNTEGDQNTEVLIGRLGYGAVWTIGSIVALGVLGLDFAALLGALGLTSVAIGFSLKDVLSNYISGVILLAARPFRLGDQVVIKAYEGTITQIQLRATTLKTYDGSVVYIPNQEVFQASIINHTASPVRRSKAIVGIDYDADIGEAKQVILEAIATIPEVESSPTPQVLVKELAASTVNLEVLFWVNSRRADFIEITALATQAIKEALQTAQVEMPTEIYTLLFRQQSPLEVGARVQSSEAFSQAQLSPGAEKSTRHSLPEGG